MSDFPTAPVPCETCHAPAGSPCVFLEGPNAGKPRGPRYGLHDERKDDGTLYGDGFIAGASSRQSEVDEAVTAREAAEAGLRDLEAEVQETYAEHQAKIDQLDGNLRRTEQKLDQTYSERNEARDEALAANQRADAAEKRYADHMATHPVVVEPGRPVPADAVWLHPTGADTNPGTRDKPRKTPKDGYTNALHGGTYAGFAWFAPDGTKSALQVPEGQTAILDGQGTKARALKAGGKVDLYGKGIVTGYNTPYSDDTNAVAVYFGGTAAGSEVDGWTIEHCAMAALGTQVPIRLTRLLVQDMGYSGILGTTADGTILGDVRVLRINRGQHAQDGQLGAIKFTRSAGLRSSKNVYIEDTGGAIGLWCDVSCRDPHFAKPTVRTGNGKPAKVGLLFEQTQGGIVAGADVEGIEALRIAASGGLRIWESKFVGTSVAALVWQDRPKNSGQSVNLPATPEEKARNYKPTVADIPWWTVDNEIANTELTATGGHKIALTAYAHGGTKYPAVKGAILGKDMTSLRGNTYGGTVKLGDSAGAQITHSMQAAQSALGTRFTLERVTVPAEVAALL